MLSSRNRGKKRDKSKAIKIMDKRFLILMLLVILCGCASLPKTVTESKTVLFFGPNRGVTISEKLPDITKWHGPLTPIFQSPNFDIFVWKGTDPDDKQDVCSVFIAHEMKNYDIIIIAIGRMNPEGEPLNRRLWYDKEYFETGVASRRLIPVDQMPNLKELVQKKAPVDNISFQFY
jgi:hypothetical protein